MGIIFIMFVLGLEFNYSKISKVWRISLLGSLALLAVTVLIIFLLGQYFFDADSVKESLIIGFTVFLSSTAVVLKCLEPDEMDTLYGRSIIGILVAQDLLLGLLLAILPSFGKASFLHMAQSLASIMGVMIIFLLIVGSLYPFIQYIIKLILHSKRNRELLVMSSIGLCVFLTKIAANFNLPVELACFVAGVVISPPEKHQDTLIHTIEPIRDMFSALFFACIGLHIYPTFLIDEAALLFGLTVATTLFKFVVGVLVLFLLFRYDLRTASFIAIALSQMSEFAFLFASRAKR